MSGDRDRLGWTDGTPGKFIKFSIAFPEPTLKPAQLKVGKHKFAVNCKTTGSKPLSGNRRRQSYAHAPMPRMTNTFMRAGNDNPAELLSRVRNGIFAKSFGGGQVDIVSGKFVFSCTEAYRIENGKLGAPIKGATLIGDGPTVLTKVTGIGNDFALDEGVGMCGKGGQGVPAGVGQPTLLGSGLMVSGTGGKVLVRC